MKTRMRKVGEMSYLSLLWLIEPKRPVVDQLSVFGDNIACVDSQKDKGSINDLLKFMTHIEVAIKKIQKTPVGHEECSMTVYLNPLYAKIDFLYFAKALIEENKLSYRYGVEKSNAFMIVRPAQGKELSLLLCAECKVGAQYEHHCLGRDVKPEAGSAATSCQCIACREKNMLLGLGAFDDPEYDEKAKILRAISEK